jgi:hypothetical protein
MAGGTNLPCAGCTEGSDGENIPGSCDDRISGTASCKFNRVVIGVTEDLQGGGISPNADGSIDFAVAYRYVGKANDIDTPPSDDPSVGDPLGILIPTSTYSGYTNVFTDIGNNPCPVANATAGCPKTCTICH